ncbi:MAG: Uma2 family endonuclease [Caulobacter sp.]|nr:Uma2 family endonuclease [Caulobacter sp.]
MTATNPGFEERGDTEFLFDFDQFELMDQAGVFNGVEGRVELIEGKVLQMAPTSPDHSSASNDVAVSLTNKLTAQGLYRTAFRVLPNATLKIGERSAPEPDVLVARPFADHKYPEPSDVALVVEVSISTRDSDLTSKSRLYAQARIPEYWVVEPETRKLTVHREPQPDGTWGSVTVLEGDAYVSPLFSSQIHIPLSELF